MNNKIKRFLATIIFSLLPFLVLSEQIETQISADIINIERGEILYAEGNVQVQHGDNRIKAQALKFKQKSNEIKFIEIQAIEMAYQRSIAIFFTTEHAEDTDQISTHLKK